MFEISHFLQEFYNYFPAKIKTRLCFEEPKMLSTISAVIKTRLFSLNLNSIVRHFLVDPLWQERDSVFNALFDRGKLV
jgi:hypothetical protein